MAATARKSGSGRFVNVTRRGNTISERVAEVYRKLDTGAYKVDQALEELAKIENRGSFPSHHASGRLKT